MPTFWSSPFISPKFQQFEWLVILRSNLNIMIDRYFFTQISTFLSFPNFVLKYQHSVDFNISSTWKFCNEIPTFWLIPNLVPKFQHFDCFTASLKFWKFLWFLFFTIHLFQKNFLFTFPLKLQNFELCDILQIHLDWFSPL